MKNMGADGLLYEFREVAFFHALGAQKSTQGEICFLRDLDVPPDCFLLHILLQAGIGAYTANYKGSKV